MDFGIALPTPADSRKIVKRAEDAGFSTAWFYDTQVLSADIFVAMGAAAVKTDRIRLGAGVLIPSNRIAPVAANGLATLNALAPGRIDAGFGTGYTGRRSMGLGPHKLSDMDEYIRVIMAMLRGEKPEIRIEAKNSQSRISQSGDEADQYRGAGSSLCFCSGCEGSPHDGRAGRTLDQRQFHRGLLSHHGQEHGGAVPRRRKGLGGQAEHHILLWLCAQRARGFRQPACQGGSRTCRHDDAAQCDGAAELWQPDRGVRVFDAAQSGIGANRARIPHRL